ncbi:adenylate/guanylate cyclase domain-containing protein [Staphylococcus caprae]|uniref:adenylate/guanylate cyclase domain-containing protein n=1 Tax=Staphylococcus caprae TaxID=29380 RepID=UPI001F56CC91|nr:adenylate/guanylate cyclase domain-containing protein [Staphylococcus caprae]MCI2954776.1 adenylate/guanylate cyclase domain-containing protein [Staphylococcus caprae]
MRADYKEYDFSARLNRIDDILSSSLDTSYHKESFNIKDLNDNQAIYIDCVSIFIDLRDSTKFVKDSDLQRKSLGKIYKTYISEMVAIVNSFSTCWEIDIVGDCVSAIFVNKRESDNIFKDGLQAASMCNGMLKVLNKKYEQKWGNKVHIKAGIGLASGNAMVMKVGLFGSKDIKEGIYIGDVVNKASKLCDRASKNGNNPIFVSEEIYNHSNIAANQSTNDTFKDFLNCYNTELENNLQFIYSGSFFRLYMNNWVKDQT